MTTVRQVGEEDWHALRLVRLAALADSPGAFASSLAAETGRGEVDWRRWAASAPVFLAFADGVPVAMVAAFDGDAADEWHLVALWVEPGHRRSGVASTLLSRVEDRARRDGARRLTLWVAEDNAPARRLYAEHGFTSSGKRQPLPSNPAVEEEQLVLTL